MRQLIERKDRAAVSEGGGGARRERREVEVDCQASRRATSIDTNDRGRETAGAECSVSVWCCQQL